MMKTQLLKNIMSLTFMVLAYGYVHAQNDTTIILDPAQFIPADTGYYIAGVDKDIIGKDGIPEHYDGCFDAYGDIDHKESGEQNGWKYDRVIIFRGCSSDPSVVDDAIKGTVPTENWPAVGNIIQLGKHKYPLTDSATFSYLESPAFSSITSLNVKVGTDLSINNNRSIFILIEASKDGGETWEYIDNPDGTAFIQQQLTNQGGDDLTFTAGTNDGFDAIVALSQAGPIKIRLVAIPPPLSNASGERLKIWGVTIVGKTVPKVVAPLANNLELKAPYTFSNSIFTAIEGREISVYNLSGRLIGSGKSVAVHQKGLFIVRADNGYTKKVLLK
jgi:hypothetical protein